MEVKADLQISFPKEEAKKKVIIWNKWLILLSFLYLTDVVKN